MKCPYPVTIRSPNILDGNSHIAVPCGKCGICLRNEVSMWKIRINEELKLKTSNSFVTLTYDENNVPPDGVSKDDLQKFFKKLRHVYEFRYYAISEYGPTTFRPHYHIIFFGLDEYTGPGVKRVLEKTWSKGFVTIDNICPERVNYICEYHVLRFNYPDGKNPNFKLLSSRPGIGANYISAEKNFHSSDKNMYYRNGNYKLALPRYYKEKLYSREARLKASKINQKKEMVSEYHSLENDALYYRKRWYNTKNTIELYLKRKRKNKKL